MNMVNTKHLQLHIIQKTQIWNKIELGVLDFVHVFPELGTAYIADGTGHANPEKRVKLAKLWDDFNTTFEDVYKRSEIFDSQEKVEKFLRERILNLSRGFEENGISSTLSLSMLIKINEKKYVASIHAGDSTLWHITKNSKVHRITPADAKDVTNQAELSSLDNSRIYFDMREVESGDKIIGLTDGITDYLPEQKLYPLLLDKNNESDLLEKLETAIVNSAADNQYPNIKPFDSKDKHKSDDISVFMMIVP